MKKLIGLLVVLLALLGLTVTELVWGGSDAEADGVETAQTTPPPPASSPRVHRSRLHRR